MKPSIGVVFDATVENIVEECANLGVTPASVCESIGTSRATLRRWRKKRPLTIVVADKIQGELARIRTSSPKG